MHHFRLAMYATMFTRMPSLVALGTVLTLERKPDGVSTHAAFLLPVAGLFCFHLYLIARGMTTYEAVEGGGAIYSQGLCKNCWNVWFARTPPPFVDFSQPTRTANGQQPPEIVAKYNPQHGGSTAGVVQQQSPMHRQYPVHEMMGDQNC